MDGNSLKNAQTTNSSLILPHVVLPGPRYPDLFTFTTLSVPPHTRDLPLSGLAGRQYST